VTDRQTDRRTDDITISVVPIFISPSMPLTGLSLEMYIFHFEAISLSTLHSYHRFQATDLHKFGLVGKAWPVDGSKRMSVPKMGLWATSDL
jgi:hypothetical protein